MKITGTIISNTTGLPVASARISVPSANKIAFSDSGGNFFVLVPASEYIVKIEKKDFVARTLTVNSSNANYGNILLTPGDRNMTGTVVDNDNNQPIQGATIEIKSLDNEFNVYSGKTDLNGNFSFTNLPYENYTLKIEATNYNEFSYYINKDSITTLTTYRLTPNKDTKFKITGSVYQAGNSTPIAGASVTLQYPNGTVLDTTITDSSGSYIFQNIPAGLYTIYIRKDSYLDYTKTVEINGDLNVDDIYMQLSSGTTPTGSGTKEVIFSVIDADTGTRISGAIVTFNNTIYNAITNDNGISTFEVPVSTYNVEIKKDGYITQTRNIDVAAINDTVEVFMIYDLVSNLGNIKGKITRSDFKDFTHEVIVEATLHTADEIGQDISIVTVADQNTNEYKFENLQILYDPDGQEYKYIIAAKYDFNDDGTFDTDEISYQIVDLEAGKTSIADVMLIVP
jgi:hypothetical protein